MARHIFKCNVCGRYTMSSNCCQKATIIPRPPKYSPEDKYSEYRRMAKKDMLEKEGLL